MKTRWFLICVALTVLLAGCKQAAESLPPATTTDTNIESEWGNDLEAQGGIAVGPEGQVFVTINNSHRVVAFSPEGELLTAWDVEGEMGGIAVGPEGQVFVTINNSHRVVAFSPEGELLTAWEVDGEMGGIAVGPRGDVFVNINNNHHVVKFSPAGELLTVWDVW